MRVRVEIDPKYRESAVAKGYDVEPFDAELLPGVPFVFWHRVRPLSGRHAAPVDLPPMFGITPIKD